MSRITLQDIADHTGLSKFAVSCSLSGKPGVSDTTRKRVQDAAVQLGYQRLKPAEERREITLIFHDQVDSVSYELRTMLQDGMQREAHRLGQPVRLQWTHDANRVEAMVKDSAGIILVGPHEQKTLDILRASGVPVVRLGWVAPLEQADHVGGTDHEAGIAVGEYLIGLGHRDIAFLQGEEGYRGRMERYHGLRESIEQYPDARLHNLHFKEDGGFIPALQSLQTTGIAPTALFCAHDGLALTAVSELLARGYRIPEDMSVVGFGDFSAATQISPQLTTIKVQGLEMGATALRLLLERIETQGDTVPARRILIASTFVERRSSGPAPKHGKSLDQTTRKEAGS
ncbi:LacI family DNA-binding transcriptional regulator [Sinorhizobium medicae]|uniref:LacI family DNA-binding transcriptional regulator n=1 Tax=Sinorhizobium medicae TaxID=110321 RepID=UPI00040B46FE|nr:LacI family DNA-binding transcriptional regulator [Sinorhizobium medicae]MDX1065188.1 LacI family DNA-binding transcriptional regulator [Sinorhizobium medicae]MDX1084150.1 LacI family DNA-binding transcriptional regulator [Sinorhizobium medicae]RVJ63850.1 LacI family transcriptional regulator [Sinorhizobium medicae]RVJ68946.1 LacI family transcriptional regulator [Sinorhizobium medicae]